MNLTEKDYDKFLSKKSSTSEPVPMAKGPAIVHEQSNSDSGVNGLCGGFYREGYPSGTPGGKYTYGDIEFLDHKVVKCTRKTAVYGYKGLKKMADGSLKCRDLVYEPGTIYCHDADPKTCSTGFHFCEKLEDVFKHYSVTDENHVFYKVEAWGKISNDSSDGKASSQFIMLTTQVSEDDLFLSKIRPTMETVDSILLHNNNAIICGSLALILRGWIPFRQIGDIDILLPYYQDFGNGNTERWEIDNSFGKSGTETIQISIPGLAKFDLFIDPAETWSWMQVGNKKYKVAHVKRLIEAKMRYYMQGAHKHDKDLKNIFDQIEKNYEGDKNAFLKNGNHSPLNKSIASSDDLDF